ncbi:hypothetical protein HDU97_008275 [Phlyctochytrium planicorne]|nr:hypothetical protein HDU97_008275 [Phlyctochytrium planicorne]
MAAEIRKTGTVATAAADVYAMGKPGLELALKHIVQLMTNVDPAKRSGIPELLQMINKILNPDADVRNEGGKDEGIGDGVKDIEDEAPTRDKDSNDNDELGRKKRKL